MNDSSSLWASLEKSLHLAACYWEVEGSWPISLGGRGIWAMFLTETHSSLLSAFASSFLQFHKRRTGGFLLNNTALCWVPSQHCGSNQQEQPQKSISMSFFFFLCYFTEPRKCVLISLGNLLSLLFNGLYGSGETCIVLKAKEREVCVYIPLIDSAKHDHLTRV